MRISIPSLESLKYSNNVRKRVIDTAIKLLCKVGCEVSECTNENTTVLTVLNPPDHADRHGAMANLAIDQAFNA